MPTPDQDMRTLAVTLDNYLAQLRAQGHTAAADALGSCVTAALGRIQKIVVVTKEVGNSNES